MITWLADADDVVTPEPFAGPDHPMRKITRAVADGDGWSAERAGKIADLFDSMAEGWSADHISAERAAPIVDALDRGGVPLDKHWIEIGSGTGAGAQVLATRLAAEGGSLVCTDLSMEMLRHARGDAPLVRADAASLPFPDASFDVALMINMILFPAEVVRVVRGDGAVLWANTLGDQTPIHLTPTEVANSLSTAAGELWTGVAANAGTGFGACYAPVTWPSWPSLRSRHDDSCWRGFGAGIDWGGCERVALSRR